MQKGNKTDAIKRHGGSILVYADQIWSQDEYEEEKNNKEISSDISNNNFVKQKWNPLLQDEMSEDEDMGDKDKLEWIRWSFRRVDEWQRLYWIWDKARQVKISTDTSGDREWILKKLLKMN